MGNRAPKTVVPVDKNVALWCPFCDWHLTDSFSSRRHLGAHIGSCHRGEVAFPLGTEPPDLEKD